MPPLLLELWNHLHDVRVLWELAVVAASLLLAWRLTRAGRLAFLWEDDQPVSEDAPTVAYEPPVPQAA